MFAVKKFSAILKVMNKRIIGGLIGIVGLSIGMVVVLNNTQKDSQPSTSIAPTMSVVKMPSEELQEYVDDSGFSFQYSKDITIKKQEDKDDTLYANLLLVSDQVNGNISIKIADSKLSSLDEWLENTKEATMTGKPNEIKFSGMSAYELKNGKKIVTVALDNGILFTISMEALENSIFWQKVYDKLINSFSFTVPQTSTGESTDESQSSGDEIVEEEEIIE